MAGPGHVAAFLCTHVFDREREVRYVVHNTDGDWQLLCGGTDHAADDCRLVGLVHAVEDDPSLNEILDLPLGMAAERDAAHAPWRRMKHEGE